MASKNELNPMFKLVLDLGPLLLFFVVEGVAGIFWATGVLMVAAAVAFVVSYAITREIPILPVITLVFVLIFGALTVLLGDENFIKLEVTLTNALCGIILLAGLAFDKSLLKVAFGEVVGIDGDGWKKLTLRLGLFLLCIAVANEFARQMLATDTWVMFRVYGIFGLSGLFFITQVPMLKRHLIEE